MIASSRCELLRATAILLWSWVELTQRSWGLFVIWHYVKLGSRTRGTVTQCFSFNHKSFFYPFSYQEKMSFCESRKNRLEILTKCSFQKTCLSKPGQYSMCNGVHSYIVLNLTKTFLCYTLRFERHKVRKMFIMYRLFSKPLLKSRVASAIFWNYLGIFTDYDLKNIFFFSE